MQLVSRDSGILSLALVNSLILSLISLSLSVSFSAETLLRLCTELHRQTLRDSAADFANLAIDSARSGQTFFHICSDSVRTCPHMSQRVTRLRSRCCTYSFTYTYIRHKEYIRVPGSHTCPLFLRSGGPRSGSLQRKPRKRAFHAPRPFAGG